eukprot:TRINITY_DN12760_c0_g1_i1.p1 TRINITY_DN12760_c0_g1~~TRINITY_DN12760_c0_g1_i1.p1  ORF type:complete len:465 (-),score=35.79 TRINITY_DN12760_c0_g1_i1:189-1583(-)
MAEVADSNSRTGVLVESLGSEARTLDSVLLNLASSSPTPWELPENHLGELHKSSQANSCSIITSCKRSLQCPDNAWNCPGSKKRKILNEGRCVALSGGLIQCQQTHSSKETLTNEDISEAIECEGGDCACCVPSVSTEECDAQNPIWSTELSVSGTEVPDSDLSVTERSLVNLQCPSCGLAGTVSNSSDDGDNELEEHKVECTTCGHSWLSLFQAGKVVATLGTFEADAPGLECQEESHGAVGDELDGDDEGDPFVFIKRLPQLSHLVPENRPDILPERAPGAPPVTLVLDLDETLVHSTMDFCPVFDFRFPVTLNSHVHMVHVRKRPQMEAFLEKVSSLFEVVVFTASQSIYAEKLLDIIDPEKKFIQHRIYRESCVYIEGTYVKDLSALGRDLSKVIIVDNSPQAFGLQVNNGIPIEPFFDDENDTELDLLIPFLEKLASVEDVRPQISKKFNLWERINRVN